MPTNKFQKIVFALLTIIITVHAFVFFSLYVVNGNLFMQITGENSVLNAINKMGGISVFNNMILIWAVIIIEFVLAFSLEMLLGSHLSFKLSCKVFDPTKTHPVLFETAIISATVAIMCPTMSFIAAFLYYPDYSTFNVFTLLANLFKTCMF